MLVLGDAQTPFLFDTEAAWISLFISQVSLGIQQDTSGVLLGRCLLRGKHELLQNFSKARPSRPMASPPLYSSVQSKARSASASKKGEIDPEDKTKQKSTCVCHSLCVYTTAFLFYIAVSTNKPERSKETFRANSDSYFQRLFVSARVCVCVMVCDDYKACVGISFPWKLNTLTLASSPHFRSLQEYCL